MKSVLSSIALALTMLLLASCNRDEPTTELLLTTVSNSSPSSLAIEYHTPDPAHFPLSYFITTNFDEGTLVLECTTSDSLFVSNKPGYQAVVADMSTSLTDLNSQWTASVTDGNRLTITFDKITNPSDDDTYETRHSNFYLYGLGHSSNWTRVYITRHKDLPPIDWPQPQ